MPESSVRHSPIEAYQTESGPAYPLVTHVKALYGTLQGHHQHAQPGVIWHYYQLKQSYHVFPNVVSLQASAATINNRCQNHYNGCTGATSI